MIGASWGGLYALSAIVSALPLDYALAVVIVQHRRHDAGTLLCELLQDQTSLHVTEPEDKEPIKAGTVYVAPADYHLLVERDHFTLSLEEAVRFSRPSIDVAFTSAADTCGSSAVGVVLTGANEDGAHGLHSIADSGGLALVQDPASAECAIMPAAARKLVPGAEVLSLAALASRIAALRGRDSGTRSSQRVRRARMSNPRGS